MPTTIQASLTPEGGPSAPDIRACLRRLLGDAAFRATARRRRLLEYVVEQMLAGQAERLKAYDLALSVLGRDERFDPQYDPIVRIEVGRLRRDLEHWYLTDGRDDPIRITIPKGHYVPAFERHPDQAPPAPMRNPPAPRLNPSGRPLGWRWSAAGGLCVLVLIGVAIWSTWWNGRQAQAPGPVLVVVPFKGLSGGEGGRLLADGLTSGLIVDLMRYEPVQVFMAPPGGDTSAPLPGMAADAPAYVVTGSVEREPGQLRVTAKLTDRVSGQVLWSQRYDQALTAATVRDVQDDISTGIASRLAQDYGVVQLAAARQLAGTVPKTMLTYDCIQRARAYRLHFDPNDYPPVRACLEEAVRREPGDAGAWAMLAFAHMDAARYWLVEPSLRAGELDAGLAAARRAVGLAPESVRSLQSLAALLYARGEFADAERVQRQAIALNPHDPESLAQLGWRLVVRGRWDEGGQLLQTAIDRSLVTPTWYHLDLAFALYLGGDFERAHDAAKRARGSCCGYDHVALALTEQALGRTASARQALEEAIRTAPLLEQDPVAFWSRFQVAPEVIERLNAGLVQAGLELPVPTTPIHPHELVEDSASGGSP